MEIRQPAPAMMRKPSNPWPAGIILFISLFVCGTVGLIVFSSAHRMELVTPDYYQQEILYQGQIDRQNRAQSLPRSPSIRYEPDRGKIVVELPVREGTGRPSGRIWLYRPSSAGLDQELELDCDEQGRQWVDAGALEQGLWRVRVSWSVGPEKYYYDQAVVLRKNQRRDLRSRDATVDRTHSRSGG